MQFNMKKCKEKVIVIDHREIVKRVPSSSKFIIGGPRSLSTWLLVLSVITTYLVDIRAVHAQLAEPMQQISVDSPSQSLRNDPNLIALTPRHGGNLYAPQHGYDNNIEFVHDQTESIYEVPSQLDGHNEQQHVDNHQEQEDLPESGANEEQGGAGDTYLHNGAPELEADADLHHRHHHHHLDESLNENQLPDDGNEPMSEFTEIDGGPIVGQRILRQSESPYVLNTDLEVERGGSLVIEPGVTVEFAPMVGITVRGVITAVVSDELGCNSACN